MKSYWWFFSAFASFMKIIIVNTPRIAGMVANKICKNNLLKIDNNKKAIKGPRIAPLLSIAF